MDGPFLKKKRLGKEVVRKRKDLKGAMKRERERERERERGIRKTVLWSERQSASQRMMCLAVTSLWHTQCRPRKDEKDVSTSVTRLGDFWKFWVTNFLAKVVQMYVDFLNSFECIKFSCINWFGYFLGKFRIILGYFIFQHPVALVSTKHPWRRRNNPETTEYLIPPFLMHLLASVWPDWAIFESSLQQFFF